MRRLVRITIMLWLMTVWLATAADFDPTTGKTTRKERKADKLVEAMAYQSAVDLYQEVIKKNSNNFRVHLKLAEAYVKLNETENAEDHYRQYITQATLSPNEKLQFAQVLMSNQKHTEAEIWVKAYQKDVPRSVVAANLLQSIRFQEEFFKDSANYEVRSLGFNTDQVEFAPAYYQQGLVFASSRKQQLSLKKKYHWDRSNYLDLYQVSLDAESHASDPTPLAELNSKLHEGPVTFFDNDQQAILTRNHYRTTDHKTGDGINTLQLFHAQKSQEGKWDNIEPLPFNGSEFSTGHPSYEDGVLYYASNKEGGYGGVDLYKVNYSDGQWGRPENLGPQINTEGDEQFPFIKNQVLYFASNAHAGLGGLDIFKTNVREDGTIEEIENLGYPINSSKDDFGFITKDGLQGYFATHRDGSDDIYHFQHKSQVSTPEEAIVANMLPEQDQISKIPANIVERKSGFLNFSEADVVVLDQRAYLLADQKILEIRRENDGYRLTGSDGGIKVKDQEGSLDLEQALKTLGINVTREYHVSTIYYGFDKSSIGEDAARELDQLAALLQEHQHLRLNLDSHTDSRGSSRYNDALSQRRSQAAKQYLINQGVDTSRLITTAHGEKKLTNECADNNPCEETDHRKNRRTQFSLVI